jgi:hypothetical protein
MSSSASRRTLPHRWPTRALELSPVSLVPGDAALARERGDRDRVVRRAQRRDVDDRLVVRRPRRPLPRLGRVHGAHGAVDGHPERFDDAPSRRHADVDLLRRRPRQAQVVRDPPLPQHRTGAAREGRRGLGARLVAPAWLGLVDPGVRALPPSGADAPLDLANAQAGAECLSPCDDAILQGGEIGQVLRQHRHSVPRPRRSQPTLSTGGLRGELTRSS